MDPVLHTTLSTWFGPDATRRDPRRTRQPHQAPPRRPLVPLRQPRR